MAINTNIVILTGHLGADPEIRQFQNGGQIATLNLAVGDDYRDQQKNIVNRTHWITVVIHGNYSDVARQYLHKGSKVTVTGKLVQENWQDQNGNNRSTLKVAARSFEMHDTRANNEQIQSKSSTQPQEKPTAASVQNDGFDDEILF